MKRAGYLYERIVSADNMALAIDAALKRKAWKREASRILNHRAEAAKWLAEHPFPENRYRPKTVTDPASGKVRDLLVPCAADLVRQHAVMQVLQSILENGFYEHSYACRKGFGATKCAMYVRSKLSRMANRRTYFAKIDVVKFYDSVDLGVMKSLLRRSVKDERALALVDAILDGTGRKVGIPIGNYTSQILANFYLTPADRYAKQTLRIPLYVRYADDMLIASHNKRELKRQADALMAFLSDALKLRTHRERVSIRKLSDEGDGFLDICGFKIYRSHTKIRKRTFRRIRRIVSKLGRFVTLKHARSLMSYWGYIRRADCFAWQKRSIPPGLVRDCRRRVSLHDKAAYAATG